MLVAYESTHNLAGLFSDTSHGRAYQQAHYHVSIMILNRYRNYLICVRRKQGENLN